ncbi:hypothetical protein [Burkholderia pseudomallei]|uniref:hypothetical protein n=1 Tax=Burkholderia pseudomallei TaxID=28450 RepID=UPI0015E1B7F6
MTADAAYLDDDGYLFYQSRDDARISGLGYTSSPAEVEEALLSHADVLAGGFVGRADGRRGMLGCAPVVPRRGVHGRDGLTAGRRPPGTGQVAAYR